jgi:hypothetical protein
MVRSEGDMSLKNPVTVPGIDPGTVRLVAQRLNHHATPGPYFTKCTIALPGVDNVFLFNLFELFISVNTRVRGHSPAVLRSQDKFVPVPEQDGLKLQSWMP